MIRFLAAAALLCTLAAPAAASGDALGAFFAERPRYAVLPAPYFEPGTRPESYLEVNLNARAWVGAGVAWHAEIDTGVVQRVPATGTSKTAGWAGFLPLGDRPVAKAELRIYAHEHGATRQVARVAIPRIVPTRFSTAFARGLYGRQVARDWGEDGAWLVLLQLRHAPDFFRRPEPIFYVGGDFNYQRIEGVVRYLRTHGVNAIGYKPDFDRDHDEGFLDMARHDMADVRRFLALAGGDRPADVVGLCVGGLYARGLAFAERRELKPARPLVKSVTTVGTPHHGSELADIYNAVELLPAMHRLVTGNPNIHKYKDSRHDVAAFNAEVGSVPEVPHGSVVLDPQGERPDPRYDTTDWPLKWLIAWETGVKAETVATDGLITIVGQVHGRHLATWKCDHAGMINDGRSATYFNAYRAHLELAERLGRE